MKIAIVNDVPMIAEALRRVVASRPGYQVVWVAHSGAEAIRLCAQNRPDLILMDLLMGEMDGVQTTRHIMQRCPCAILIVTATPEDNTNMVFRALGAGALDVTATPILSGQSAAGEALLAKIRTIGALIKDETPPAQAVKPPAPANAAVMRAQVQTLVAIGASTGGPLALAKLLSEWKPGSRTAMVVVQHLDERFTDSFAHWLAAQASAPVQVIQDGSTLTPGRIFIAKTNDHLCMDEYHRLRYSPIPRDYPYRPSINVFFECVARYWQGNAVGVLLTGMGRDGAQGLLGMRHAGKLTIAQDQASSAVYGMPRAAAELDAADMILPLQDIAAALRSRDGQYD